MSKLIIVLLLAFAIEVHAQKKVLPYKSLTTVGLAQSANATVFSAYTFNGVEKNKYFFALGTGFDNVGVPSIPILAYAQKRFFKRKNEPYLYGFVGPTISVKTKKWRDNKPFFGSIVLKNGYMAETGIGYLLKLGKTTRLNFNLGITFKEYKYIYNYNDFICGITGCFPVGTFRKEFYKIRNQTFTLKTGIFL